jgi:dUTPase
MTPKKDDMKPNLKIIVDILQNVGIVDSEYTGKLTLHITQGTISGIQVDKMIRIR